jgi:hypothetical protein
MSPAAQAPTTAAGVDAVKAFIVSRVARNWTPPKTPWGHPDIQGVFTTKDEANTPFERPEEWAGRRIEDITPAELSAAIVRRQEAAVERAPFAGGGDAEAGISIAVPIHWFDNLASKNSRPWFLIDPPEGKIPPRTAEAQAKSITLRPPNGERPDSYVDRDVADRCIVFSSGGVWQLPAIYGNSYQILQTRDYIIMRYEMVHEARMIPLDGRPNTSSRIRGYVGESRGHWDGNTLVVVTTNFNENLEYRDFPVFSRNLKAGGGPMTNLRLTERFTRIAPDKVEWTTTVEDLTQWTRPWTYSFPLSEDNKQMIYEYACHEGNYGMANILSAQRAADRKAGTAR